MKHEIDVSEASHEVRLHIFYCFSDFDDIDNYLINLAFVALFKLLCSYLSFRDYMKN